MADKSKKKKKKRKVRARTRLIPPPVAADGKDKHYIVSIANRKGGVGKTTFTTNIAHELYRAGFKVAMVDLDSQQDLTDIHLQGKKYKHNLFDLLMGRCSGTEALVSTTSDGKKKIIPGSDKVSRVSQNVVYSLKKGIDDLKEDFHIVLLDHPPDLTRLSRAGFAISHHVLIVLEPDGLSYKNIDTLITELKEIREEGNKNLNLLGLAVNKVDKRRKITKKVIDELRRRYPEEVFSENISIDTAIPNSQWINTGPVRDLPWRSRTLSQFQHLCLAMLMRMGVYEK